MKRFFLLLLPFLLASAISFSQSRKIINDYALLTQELVSIKSEAEEYARDVKQNWSNDTLKRQGMITYTNLLGAVDGVIANFQIIIRKPTLINNTYKANIQKSLDSLNKKLSRFKEFYAKGSLIIVKGSGMTSIDVNAVIPILKAGASLYTEIRNIVASQREQTAKQFGATTKLTKWDDLK